MKILVTGGAGFIGSNFIRYMIDHSDGTVVNLDKLTYAGNLMNLDGVSGSHRYQLVRGDIADSVVVDSVVSKGRFDAIVNFAAESHVDRSIAEPSAFVQTNIVGTQVLLEAVRRHDVPRFVQISTDEVYGSLGHDGFFTEEHPLGPNNPYAASKAAADLLVRAYSHTYGLPAIITRSSNNYGPYQHTEKLIPRMITKAILNQSLPIYGRGENIRDWLYVEDHCRAIALVLAKGQVGEVYNIGGAQEAANIEIVRRILKELGRPDSLMVHVDDRPGHDFRYAMAFDKIRQDLGWAPLVTLEAGLERTIRWYVDNTRWWQNS